MSVVSSSEEIETKGLELSKSTNCRNLNVCFNPGDTESRLNWKEVYGGCRDFYW
jgi:hypothetical protein